MNGVMTPGVSAGSNHVGASDTWTANVIWPSGAADTAGGSSRARARTTANSDDERRCFIVFSVLARSLRSRRFSGHRARGDGESRAGHEDEDIIGANGVGSAEYNDANGAVPPSVP